jgi:hypothetical protein
MFRIIAIFLFFQLTFSQIQSFQLYKNSDTYVLESQIINDMDHLGDTLILATNLGVGFSFDDGESWGIQRTGKKSSALDIFVDSKKNIWVSFLKDTVSAGENMLAGDGLAVFLAEEKRWMSFSQPMDPENFDTDKIIVPVRTEISNITYSIAETLGSDRYLWIASFAGSLRRLNLNLFEQTREFNFELITPNGEKLNVGENSHLGYGQRCFALASTSDSLFVGTANGIYFSANGGELFENLNAHSSNLFGNFVTFLKWKDSRLFINSRFVDGGQKSGFQSYKNVFTDILEDVWVYSFEYFNRNFYLGTANNGLISTNNLTDFSQKMKVYDEQSNLTLNLDKGIESLFAHSNKLWIGTQFGLASQDDLSNYRVFKSKKFKDKILKNRKAVAYPSPFSPYHSLIDEIKFSFPNNSEERVSLEIFDFAMRKVFTENYSGLAFPISTILWNGKTKEGQYLANGVYFFRIKSKKNEFWNKFMIMN